MKTGNIEEILKIPFDATRFPPMQEGEEPAQEIPYIPMDVPEKIFEKTFDVDLLETCKKRAQTYEPMAGRFDPFNYELMKGSVGAWSALIQKHVVTFEDACDHAMKLCEMWKEEDGELKEIAQRSAEQAEPKKFIEGTREYEIEQARLAWRKAVKDRNDVVKEANEKVDRLRNHYRKLRDG